MLKCAHVYVYVKQATLKVEFEVIQICYVPSELKKSVVVAKCVDKKKEAILYFTVQESKEKISLNGNRKLGQSFILCPWRYSPLTFFEFFSRWPANKSDKSVQPFFGCHQGRESILSVQ